MAHYVTPHKPYRERSSTRTLPQNDQVTGQMFYNQKRFTEEADNETISPSTQDPVRTGPPTAETGAIPKDFTLLKKMKWAKEMKRAKKPHSESYENSSIPSMNFFRAGKVRGPYDTRAVYNHENQGYGYESADYFIPFYERRSPHTPVEFDAFAYGYENM